MKARLLTFLTTIIVCAFLTEAQTLTATYVELADSADYYIKRELWKDAERVTVAALRHEPANKSNYLLWSNLGIVRTQLNDYEGAMQAYEVGLASAPKSTTLLTNRARTQLTFNHPEEAFADLDAALAVDSLLQWPLKMRGLLKVQFADSNGALRDFKLYLEHYPNEAIIAEGMGEAEAMLGNYTTAREHFLEGIKLDETDSECTEKLLLLAFSQNKLADEEPILTEAIRKWPRNPLLYLYRGVIHKNRYQNKEAEIDKKLAIDYGADPQTVEIFFPENRK